MVYDPSYPKIDHHVFKKCDWSEFYRDTEEAIPMNVPEPQGKEVETPMFIEINHAVDKVSCRSRSGFLIYKNTALVQWFSKKQFRVETLGLGAKFVAMEQGIKALRGFR